MNLLMIVVLLLMVLQSFASFIQVRNYNRFISKITKEYAGQTGFELQTDVSKGWLSKTIVAIVINEAGKIERCYICRGLTIFAGFREMKNYQNMHLKGFYEKQQTVKHLSKTENLLSNIYLRKMEAITNN